MPAIFISYRREDSAGYAGRLHEELADRFGAGQVFRDVDTLRAGQDFEDAIRARLAQCDACVVMIGPGWLNARNASGQQRLGADGDYVTLEIAAALGRPDVAVVPVLVGGASMPAPDDLPEVLRPLARRHALTARDETWEADMDRLAAVLRPATAFRSAAAAPPAPRALSRYAVPALALLLVAAGALWFVSRDSDGGAASATGDGSVATSNTEAASDPIGNGPAFAIDLPASMGEAAHGDLIYAVVAGSVQRRGDGMRVWLRIRASNEGFNDANFWDNSFRLVAGGRTFAPNGGLNVVLGRRSIEQGVITFDLPAGYRSATLRVVDADRTADLPLDLSDNGLPPKHEEQDPRDALSHAVFTPVVRNEFRLLDTDDVTIDVMRITRRAFVNAQRVTVVVKWTNNRRYGMATGDLTLRLAAGGEVRAPFRSPSEVVEPASTHIGDIVFEVPPQIEKATLRATLGGRQEEQELALQAGS